MRGCRASGAVSSEGRTAASPGRLGTSTRRRLSLLAATTGLVLVVMSAVPTFTGGGAFSRNRALDIALELGSGLVESERAAAERPALSPTELVRADSGSSASSTRVRTGPATS